MMEILTCTACGKETRLTAQILRKLEIKARSTDSAQVRAELSKRWDRLVCGQCGARNPNIRTANSPKFNKVSSGRTGNARNISRLVGDLANWVAPNEARLLQSFLKQIGSGRKLSVKQRRIVEEIKQRAAGRKAPIIVSGGAPGLGAR